MTDLATTTAPTSPRELSAEDRRHAKRPVPTGQRVKSVIKHILLVAAACVMIYPLIWMLVSSLRPGDLIFRTPGLVFDNFTTENYEYGWDALGRPFGTYMINSVIVSAGSILGNVVTCSLAAYAFARLRFTAKNILFAIMLLTIMLPFHVLIVPQYIVFSKLGMLGTFWPLILPKLLATDAFFVFLLVQFIRGLPRELDEAALIDGCGHFRIFFNIIMPLLVPAIATTAIFTFIWTWNDFFGSLLYLSGREELYTVQLGLRAFQDSSGLTNWGAIFAMSVLSLIPIFLAFLFGQRFLIRGIATTGIK
ncbi:MAG: carbohydrate ABC transporter permease [Propionibacteriaceae bacterium]|jgi:multiple sugar transport system permease protein|nr:carbohydrate ABC transporter permease [Propionibacteriaceae bacterium]